MKMTKGLEEAYRVSCCMNHGPAPIPQEGTFDYVKDIYDISGFSHGVGTCAMMQGACKLTTNVKNGVIQEALVEVIGCSGMTQSAAMASEILPGKTLLEAMNTDLVCDAINVAMREHFLNFVYGRSQSAFTDGGLDVGACVEDLNNGKTSMVGTSYSTISKGPRYLSIAEGYVKELGLDEQDRIIGYRFVNLGEMMKMIDAGINPSEALEKATGIYGRFNEAAKVINPRKD